MDYETIVLGIVLIIVIYALYKLLVLYRKKTELPYRKKELLTKHELSFYKKLRPLANKYGFVVISKIRLADLVEVDTDKTKEFAKYFAKIKAKHIDFGLVRPENMEVAYLIELDDKSHNRADRIERDEFVNALCRKTGYTLIRTCNDTSEVERVLSEN